MADNIDVSDEETAEPETTTDEYDDGTGEASEEIDSSGDENKIKKKAQKQEEEALKKDRILLKDEAMKALKRPGISPDGLGIAYIEMDLRDQELTNIEVITTFQYVTYLNVSNNKLTNEALSCLQVMQQLLMIRADNCTLSSSELPKMALLQILTLNKNNLTSIVGIEHPNLSILQLNDNVLTKIENLHSKNLPYLRRLSLKRNHIESCAGLDLPSLRYLYLQHNKIRKVSDLDNLENLICLNLVGNELSNLKGFSAKMKSLRILNLRRNKINDLVEFKKLKRLPALKRLVCNKNPYNVDKGEMRIEILARIIRLDKINKTTVTAVEKKTAKKLREELREDDKDEKEEEEDKTDEGDLNTDRE